MRPSEHAQLSLLLEVASTPKPGNVDRHREYTNLRFEHFLTGAVSAREGLDALANTDEPFGSAFEQAIAGMSRQSGGNTQFGAVLLLAPLVRGAALKGAPLPAAETVVAETTVEDAVGFYAAFDHVDVAVPDPPSDRVLPDVRQGRDAAPVLHAHDLTLTDVMRASADHDGIAAEWIEGFSRTEAAADRIATGSGPVTHRAASTFLDALATEPDTFVATQHGAETAHEVMKRAGAVRRGDADVDAFAEDLVDREINPGTTADIVAGGLFCALETGLEV